jgi:TRAP-type C4-dicarboxylate transport system substrate-binding protein
MQRDNEFPDKFKEIVEDISRGRVSVDVTSGVRSEEDVNIACSDGTIDMQSTGGEPLEVFAPEYFFFNAPYVILDYDHFKRVWASDIGWEAKTLVKENGNMYSVGTVFRGLRQMTSLKPIHGPDDIVDLKLRLPGVPTWIRVWEELEAEPVAVPLPELYEALESGRAEASEGDLTQIYSFDLFEVQDHLSITNHLVAVGWITVNEDFFKKLPIKYKCLVLYAIYVAAEWSTDQIIANEEDLLSQLQAEGMTLVYPDADAIRVKAKPAIDELFETEWPVTTWEEILSM